MNASLLLALTLIPLVNTPTSDAPPELGKVRFGRDVDAALIAAAAQKKPVFLLFQEIPGCATCKNFGAGPLTEPLLVEAIETLFVPVVVHNNKGGDDAKALERFREPAWNNPVVRWLDASGRDLIPREDGVWNSGAIATRMTKALQKSGTSAPDWLQSAALELDTSAHQRVVLGMHCFWEGQAALGALPGVVDARPGFVDGFEVVDVRFAPSVISTAELIARADKVGCATHVWASTAAELEVARSIVGNRARSLEGSVRAAAETDDLRRLKASRTLSRLKLTRTDCMRVNAQLSLEGADPRSALSPLQIAALRAMEVEQPR